MKKFKFIKSLKTKLILALTLFSFIPFFGYSTHIVGGEINYKCLGNNLYEVHLIVYRDCSGADFDDPASLAIFDANNTLYTNLSIPLSNKNIIIPTIAQKDACVKIPTNICVEAAHYITNVLLPPAIGGYQLVYQRCCRNGSISNITNPGNVGTSLYATIPDKSVACNSNPVFKDFPPIFVCANNPIVFDHSATDLDGDSIAYSFCSPFVGGTSNNPIPNPATTPPYSTATFTASYSATNPLGGGTLILDPKTGLLSGTAGTLGQFVVTICAEEFRKGVSLGSIKREFQFNVVACQPNIVAAAASSITYCTNHIVTFNNKSTGTTDFSWNFGDLTTLADSSKLSNPTYTYPALGTYTVTLIAFNKTNAKCNDTTKIVVQVDTCKPCGMTLATTKVDASCGGTGTGVCTAAPTTLFEWASKTPPSPDPCSGTGISIYYYGVTDPIGTSPDNTYYLCGATYQTITGVQWSGKTPPSPDPCPGQGSFVLADGGSTFLYVCSCTGGTGTLGSATVTATGGTTPYSYLWSPGGQITNPATDLSAGTYTVTVSDAVNCVQTASVIIDALSTMTITPSQTAPTTCGSSDGTATATVTGGKLPLIYTWNTVPVQNGSTATGLSAGVYTVNVVDVAGCSKSLVFTLSPSTILTETASKTDVRCKGGFGTATGNIPTGGGTSPYTYSWNTTPTQITQTAIGLSPGYYVVTATDVAGCKGTAAVTVNDSSLVASSSYTNATCFGGASGTATISASLGTPGYTYSWNSSPVQSTATATGLKAGTYTGVVTDNAGCKVSVTVTITEPKPVTPEPQNTSTIACAGAKNGSAEVFTTGGTSPYTFMWCNGQATATVSGLPEGDCIITVTDAKGCVGTSVINIKYPPALSLTQNFSNTKCYGSGDGAITAKPLGGKPPYTYLWSTTPVQITQTAINLPVGTYSVVVTDKIGCTAALVGIAITQPSILKLATSGTNVTCPGANDGTATVSVSGGTPTYNYSWINTNPIQTTAVIKGLAGGTYTSHITDANGCDTTVSVTILDINPIPTANFTATFQPTCYNGLVGQFYNNSNGSTSYIWDFGDGTTSTEKDPEHEFKYGKTATVSLIAINGICRDTMTMSVTADPFYDYVDPKIPNVFTPNNDGTNDLLEIKVGNGLENCVQITIFDRWGLKMYDNENGTSWDGKNKSGKIAPAGTYFYLMKIGEGEYSEYHGSITLLR